MKTTTTHRTQFDENLLHHSDSPSRRVLTNRSRGLFASADGTDLTAIAFAEERPVLRVWRGAESLAAHDLAGRPSSCFWVPTDGGLELWLSCEAAVYRCPDARSAPQRVGGTHGLLQDVVADGDGRLFLAVSQNGKLNVLVREGNEETETPIDDETGAASLAVDDRGELHLAYEKLQGIEYRHLRISARGVSTLRKERAAEAFGFQPVILAHGGRMILAYLGESCRPDSMRRLGRGWERLGRGGYIAACVLEDGVWSRYRLADSHQVVKRLCPIDGAYGGGDHDRLLVRMDEYGPPSLGIGPDGVPQVFWVNETRRWVYASRFLQHGFSAPAEVRGPFEQLAGPCLVPRETPGHRSGMPIIVATRSRVYQDTIALPSRQIGSARRIDFLQADEIAENCGVTVKINPMQRHPENPVIPKGEPGSFDDAFVVANIRRDGDGWRADYAYVNRRKPTVKTRDGRAESDDGIHWTKLEPLPYKDRYTVDGEASEHTYAIRFIIDPDEPDTEHRFKGFVRVYDTGPWGWAAVTSPDGSSWQKVKDNRTVVNADDDLRLWVDPDAPAARRFKASSISRSHPGRVCVQWTSADGMHWDGERDTLDFEEPFEARPDRGTTGRILVDPWAGPEDEDEIHGGYVFRDGNRYICHYMKWSADGHIVPALATSLDGLNFTRVAGGAPSLPLGQPGTWDSGRIALREAPFEVEGMWRQYYTGCGWKHGLAGAGARTSPFGINAPNQMGCAELPVGRWACLRLKGGFDAGELTTIPYTLKTASRLMVDLEGEGNASIVLAVLDADTRDPVPGFGFDACDSIDGSDRWKPVSWKGRGLETLGQTELRIGIRMQGHRIKLYGLELQPISR